jgi:RimJ/RimL family protein N-acetyltransferase
VPELFFPRPPLADERVLLRRFGHDDAPAVASACADPEIAEWTAVPRDYTLDHAREWLATATHEDPKTLHFAVVERESDALAGALTVWVVRPAVAEFGYWTARELRGRGYMSTAVRLASRWLLDLGFARLQLGTFPGNRASERVAEKAGFTREGVLRSWFDQRGERRRDVTMWSLLPGELR